MGLHHIRLAPGTDLKGFRAAVRSLIASRIPPAEVVWSSGDGSMLFSGESLRPGHPVSLPKAVGDLIDLVVCHRDPERYALLYTLVWRILHGERALLQVHSDPVVHRLALMAKTIRRDLHKMHAFLRFRRLADASGQERFVAWFEPDHFILEATAGFFVDRFGSLIWSILTPVGSLHWDRETLVVGPPAKRSDAPDGDAFEAGWRAYFESTFNAARTNPTLMRQHMPKKYWHNMPEAQSIPELIQSAPARVAQMVEAQATTPLKRRPDKALEAMSQQNPTSLDELNRIIAAAQPLVPGATRAVLGEGPKHANIVFVGEQPGDQEDLQGRPFVGPAGELLTRAMEEAGIARKGVYLTNAVKHFKFEQRGKRRIHQRPTAGEVTHYRWWLLKELDLVQPRLVVALGATAALALSGKSVSILKSRGETQFDDRHGFITVHPSYLLRLPDEDSKQQAYADFVADLVRIRKAGNTLAHASAAE